MERDRFKKLFPHLAREMESGQSRVDVNRDQEADGKETENDSRIWAGYEPDIIDFIRRCETVEQAEEVICYMERREEITAERAAEIREQIAEGGLRSFGPKKEEGFYQKNR